MNRKDHIDAILDSLDGVQRATPGPFFFTRLNARMQREQKSLWQRLTGTITRPVVAITGLCLVLIINVWVAVVLSGDTASGQNTELVLADEYALSSSSLYDYETNSNTNEPFSQQ